jgi:hypothetical protein
MTRADGGIERIRFTENNLREQLFLFRGIRVCAFDRRKKGPLCT